MCASHRLNPEKKRPGSTKLIYLKFNSEKNLLNNNIYISKRRVLGRGRKVLPGDKEMLHNKKKVLFKTGVLVC